MHPSVLQPQRLDQFCLHGLRHRFTADRIAVLAGFFAVIVGFRTRGHRTGRRIVMAADIQIRSQVVCDNRTVIKSYSGIGLSGHFHISPCIFQNLIQTQPYLQVNILFVKHCLAVGFPHGTYITSPMTRINNNQLVPHRSVQLRYIGGIRHIPHVGFIGGILPCPLSRRSFEINIKRLFVRSQTDIPGNRLFQIYYDAHGRRIKLGIANRRKYAVPLRDRTSARGQLRLCNIQHKTARVIQREAFIVLNGFRTVYGNAVSIICIFTGNRGNRY